MEPLVLRVRNALKIPGRDSIAATVELLNGKPVIGSILQQPDTSESWQIVGFGHGPIAPSGLYDLLLKPLGASQLPPDGSLLSERPQTPEASLG